MRNLFSKCKEMATHSSVLAWRIPGTEEPGGLLLIGSHRVGHDWSDWPCMHELEKEMATHSSVLAWRIPGREEPGGLPSMGSHRAGHDWRDLAAAATASGKGSVFQCRRQKRHRFYPWIRKITMEKGMATHSSILVWRIPWTEKPGVTCFSGSLILFNLMHINILTIFTLCRKYFLQQVLYMHFISSQLKLK